ncbi:MAG: ABC transporter permease, partial [Gemmatimonadales bacterium]
MDTLIQDLRYAVRALRKAPGFTVTAVLTLALGIGAATAGFNLLNWVILRPLPGLRDADQLGLVWFASGTRQSLSPSTVTPTQRDAILRTAPAVAGLAGEEGATQVNVAAEGQPPRQIWAEFVTSNYLTLLGERPQLGRGFAADEDLPRTGRPVAVISDGLWRGLFGGRADILGQTVDVNGLHFRVIGVGSPGFHGGDRFNQPDLWMPGETYWDVHYFLPAQRPPESGYYKFLLRLRAGASFAQAESQLKGAIGAMARTDTANFDARVTATVFPGVGLDAMGREQITHQLRLVMGLAGLMLLVACANVANLLLFRRAQRRADTVVRLVLGASRGRLIRHFLAESAILGLVGAVGGVIIALWMGEAFRSLPLLRRISIQEMSLDWRVLAFAVGAGLVAALSAGIAPALFGSRSDRKGENPPVKAHLLDRDAAEQRKAPEGLPHPERDDDTTD